jgi:acetyl esterase/lipase
LTFLFTSISLFAETLILKSGRTIEGKILEKNDATVKIDVAGVILSYYSDEIEKISQESDDKINIKIQGSKAPAGLSQNPSQSPLKNVQIGISADYLLYDGQKVRVDVYNPGGDTSPVVIVLHGSAGIEGDRASRYRNLGAIFMNNGIIAINIHYFETKNADFKRPLLKL